MIHISFILSCSINNHQPTDTLNLSHSTQSQRTDVQRWHDGTTALHTAVQDLIYEVDLAYQPDGRLAVDANADEACDIPDRSHARVADGGIQPAHSYSRLAVRQNFNCLYYAYTLP